MATLFLTSLIASSAMQITYMIDGSVVVGFTMSLPFYSADVSKLPFFVITAAAVCRQCFDAVGWATGRASGL